MRLELKPKFYVTKEEMEMINNFVEFLSNMPNTEYRAFVDYFVAPDDFYETLDNLKNLAVEEV